jgi:hypothetical protein
VIGEARRRRGRTGGRSRRAGRYWTRYAAPATGRPARQTAPSSRHPDGLEAADRLGHAVFLQREVVEGETRDRLAFPVEHHGVDDDQLDLGRERGPGLGGLGTRSRRRSQTDSGRQKRGEDRCPRRRHDDHSIITHRRRVVRAEPRGKEMGVSLWKDWPPNGAIRRSEVEANPELPLPGRADARDLPEDRSRSKARVA